MQHASRRRFLEALAGAGALLGRGDLLLAAGETPKRKAPFHVLFSNETAQLGSCPSPFRKRGEPFREAHLRASTRSSCRCGREARARHLP